MEIEMVDVGDKDGHGDKDGRGDKDRDRDTKCPILFINEFGVNGGDCTNTVIDMGMFLDMIRIMKTTEADRDTRSVDSAERAGMRMESCVAICKKAIEDVTQKSKELSTFVESMRKIENGIQDVIDFSRKTFYTILATLETEAGDQEPDDYRGVFKDVELTDSCDILIVKHIQKMCCPREGGSITMNQLCDILKPNFKTVTKKEMVSRIRGIIRDNLFKERYTVIDGLAIR
jgi:nitrogen regulatory protein PII-like uncharacterized protein